ncbi:hypothetical protein [Micromonospora inositola]|uniref:hypothetical protein n=1 Tax=Micromonospora inositola TaxID=47865 RepID=UPI0038CC1BA9
MRRAPATVAPGWSNAWRERGPAIRAFLETALVSTEFGDKWRSLMQENITVAAEFIERQRPVGHLPAGPPTSRRLASALFWMVEHELTNSSACAAVQRRSNW